jgi:hypothetical protein
MSERAWVGFVSRFKTSQHTCGGLFVCCVIYVGNISFNFSNFSVRNYVIKILLKKFNFFLFFILN